MSVAFSLIVRLRHRLLLSLSPSYRRIRERLDELSQL